ncbi:MAG TPA: sugar phosphate isomerase/epimerase family protein [Chthonomonadaceae bacterium]|nr:sugar phosphate isomerase/epimerase family protein [Chthonomonadaceae bacterium]
MNRREFIGTAAALTAAPLSPAYGDPAGRPKKSVMYAMLPGSLSIEDRFRLARDVGFEGVECGPVGSEARATELRRAAEKAGIPIQSVIYGGWDAPLSDPNPAVVAKGIANAKSAMQDAKWMGAEDILLVPAVVTAKVRYQEAYERSQKNVRALIPTAEKLDILICIEEVWNNFLLSPMEFAHYIDSFRSPHVQAYFDVGNVVTFGWPEDWIRTLGKRIKKVHLKDYKGGPGLFGGNKGSFVMLREGSINWPEVRKAFAEIGYTGYMNTELGGGDEAYLRDVSARVDKILAGE